MVRGIGRALLALGACAAVIAAPAKADAGGIQLVASKQLDARVWELSFRTTAIDRVEGVRVLLPTGYDPSGRTRYPALYLLNGALGSQTDWTLQGEAEQITAGYPLIVVMPDGGQYGSYTNWYNGGAGGSPEWETFHIGQLLPWIDSHYPTLGTRAGRAIAGLSMGGGGAMSYAARHPDLFVAAASYSGAVDSNNPEVEPVTEASGLADGAHQFGAIFGIRQTEEVRWREHNPTDLAENLAGLVLGMYTGNGMPGGPGGDTGDPVEMDVHEETLDLHAALHADGIPHLFDDYGAGGHDWYYWQRDLRWTLPWLMRAFANAPSPPSPFDFTAVEPSYSAYGWHVAIERPALEFSELRDVDRDGFELRGSGTATVTTAALYRPLRYVRATVRSQYGTAMQTLRADSAGRVAVKVPLGAGNPYQEYSAQAQPAGTAVYTARVDLDE